MPLRVLSLGNCRADDAALGTFFRAEFGAEVVSVASLLLAAEALAANEFALVLVNRVFDADDSDGVEAIRVLKQGTAHDLPVMLLSNYPEFQAAAVQAGAVPGFGKRELHDKRLAEKLRVYCQPQANA